MLQWAEEKAHAAEAEKAFLRRVRPAFLLSCFFVCVCGGGRLRVKEPGRLRFAGEPRSLPVLLPVLHPLADTLCLAPPAGSACRPQAQPFLDWLHNAEEESEEEEDSEEDGEA